MYIFLHKYIQILEPEDALLSAKNCFITNCTCHVLLKIPSEHLSYRKGIQITVSGSVTNRCHPSQGQRRMATMSAYEKAVRLFSFLSCVIRNNIRQEIESSSRRLLWIWFINWHLFQTRVMVQICVQKSFRHCCYGWRFNVNGKPFSYITN